MSKNFKIALYVLISLAFLGLIIYGVSSTKKLEKHQETAVNSNIDDYIYDETKDSLYDEIEEEDLDGEEATDEDDDFEVFEEDDGWDDDALVVDEKEEAAETRIREEKLEELYDNKADQASEEPKPEKVEPPKSTPSKGDYLVVVGSFKSQRNADKKLKKLKKANIEGEVVQLKGSKLKTAIAGRFQKRKEAQKLADKLQNEFDIRAIVKKVR